MKIFREIIHTDSYRVPEKDPQSGLDLGSVAALDPDAHRLHLPKVLHPYSIPIRSPVLERWELRQRQALGLVSQLDLFSAALIELSTAESVDQEQLHQVLMYLSRSTTNLAAVTASSLAEMIRLRRSSVLAKVPSFLLESSHEKLLSAPLFTPTIFGGIIGDVMRTDKDDQIHENVASRKDSFRSQSRRRLPVYGEPPIKRQALGSSRRPADVREQAPPSSRRASYPRGRGTQSRGSRGRGSYRGGATRGRSTFSGPSPSSGREEKRP